MIRLALAAILLVIAPAAAEAFALAQATASGQIAPMSFVTMHQFQDPAANHSLFAELSVVETLRVVETDDGLSVPAGSRGTIVAVYGQGQAYEVEFARPVVGNCTISGDLLRAA